MQSLNTTLSAGSYNVSTSTSSINFSNIKTKYCHEKELNFYLLSEFSQRSFKNSNSQPSARIAVISKNFMGEKYLSNVLRDKTSKFVFSKLNYATETYEFNRLDTIKYNSNLNVYSTMALAKSSDHIKLSLVEFNKVNFSEKPEDQKDDHAIGLCQITSVKNLNQIDISRNKAPNRIAQRKQFNKYEFIERDEKNSLFKRIAPTYFIE